jgi:hypothetical protein
MKLINSVSIASLASLSYFLSTYSSEAANFTNIQYKETAQAFELTFNWDGGLPTPFDTFRVGGVEIGQATGKEPIFWDPEVQIIDPQINSIYDLWVFGRHLIGPHTGDINPGDIFQERFNDYFNQPVANLFPQTAQSKLIAEGSVVHQHNPKPDHSDFYRFTYTRPDANGDIMFNFTGVHTPEPTSTLSLLALGTLGAASTIKRKLKPSKSAEDDTTKVG